MYLIGLFGLWCLSYGLFVRFSKSKSAKTWYLFKGVSIVSPRAMTHILIPLGITSLVLLLLILIPLPIEVREQIVVLVFTPMLLISFGLAIWPPKWLLPDWLSWLENTYGAEVAEELLSKIKNQKEWAERVSTQEGLAAWAEETYQQIQAEQEASGRR